METTEKSNLPPGCEEILQKLTDSRTVGRLPHALLFSGPAGVGKMQVAQALASWVLLEDVEPAGQGRISSLIAAGTHPDYQGILPETGKTAISVDQIRMLAGRLSLTPQIGRSKIVIISPAESMTIAAANALLKTLEEPPGDSLLILLSANPGRMPQTVRSRCQKVNFQVPPDREAIDWLKNCMQGDAEQFLSMARGTPLLALLYQEQGLNVGYEALTKGLSSLLTGKSDPLSVAGQCSEISPAEMVEWLEDIVRMLICRKMLGEAMSTSSTKVLNHLKISVDRIDLRELFKYRDFLQRARLESDANLNRELFCEEMFMRWSALGACRT